MPFGVRVDTEGEVVEILGVLPAEPEPELRLNPLPLVALQLQLLELHDDLSLLRGTFGISIFRASSILRSIVMPMTGTEAELLQKARYLTFDILLSRLGEQKGKREWCICYMMRYMWVCWVGCGGRAV
jgi:hypothetical protein